jgi:hypothetical protein
MNPRNLFAELKRRNVYKVAIAYATVEWLVIQIGKKSLSAASTGILYLTRRRLTSLRKSLCRREAPKIRRLSIKA